MMQLRLPNWLLTTALAATAALTSLSSANAQDIKAVERRLGGAVESGEITLDQAKTMLDALRKSTAKSKGNQTANIRTYYRDVQKKLAAAVKAGQISEKDAKTKLEAIRKELTAKARDGKAPARKARTAKAKPSAENVGRRLRAAVQRGDMTEAEARKKYEEVMQKQTNKPIRAKAKPTAKKKLDARAIRQRYAALQKRIEAAVKAGKISREDGEERLDAARARIQAARNGSTKAAKKAPKKTDKKKVDQRTKRLRYAEIEKRLKEAVKAGKVSPKDAEKELIEIRKEMFGARKPAVRRRDETSDR